MTPLVDREFRRILLIKPSSPGDIIHTLPVLHGLGHRYPEARIEWLVATAFAGLVAVEARLRRVRPRGSCAGHPSLFGHPFLRCLHFAAVGA